MEINNEQLGREIAAKLDWDGNSIFEAFMAALIDANFHKESSAIKKLWDDMNEEEE